MNCTHCRGEMNRATAPFGINRNSYHLTLDSVPAWTCEQCGEACFEEREVDAIQAAIRTLEIRPGNLQQEPQGGHDEDRRM